MGKNVVKISENELKTIVAHSVKKVLKEGKLGNLDSFSPDSFEDAVRVASYGDNDDWHKYTKEKNPYQDIIDKLVPIYQELSNEEGAQLSAANHILKALDLLRHPGIRRD